MNDAQVIALMSKTRAALEEIERRLDTSVDEIRSWEAQLEQPLTPERFRELRDDMVMAYARLRVLQAEYDRLMDFMRRAIMQRQSAKQAYDQGWSARLTDILAQLDEREDAEVIRVLLGLDMGDTLPF